jgi:hypothetical protein
VPAARYSGGRVLARSQPMPRYLRDCLATRQHIGLSEENYERAGRHRLRRPGQRGRCSRSISMGNGTLRASLP